MFPSAVILQESRISSAPIFRGRPIPVAFVSVAILGEPVGATLLGCVILREMPTTNEIVGGLLVLGGKGNKTVHQMPKYVRSVSKMLAILPSGEVLR